MVLIKENESSSESESNLGDKVISDTNIDFEKSPDGKIGFQEKGMDFEGSSTGPSSRFRKVSVSDYYSCSSQQELTLSYLCDNANKDIFGKNLLNGNYKGKEIMVDGDRNQESNDSFVERDFLQLKEKGRGKREAVVEDGNEVNNGEKRHKIESLNLSLALPDVSLSLAGYNQVQHEEFPARLRSTRSVQSLAPSNNTHTTYSNDFSAASLSYSYSHQFCHNLSCSLTGNSTENYEYSMGSHRRDCDKIWNGGEGTNGSVHSRFRPIGDGGVALSSHAGGSFTLGNLLGNRDSCNNSICRTTSSDNNSFFPSELAARPMMDTHSGDSKGKGSENLIGVESLDGGISQRISRSEQLLREIVSESIPTMARLVQELPQETLESTKEYLKKVIEMPERAEELASLQKKLERRSDVSNQALSKSPKFQLEILVAIKTGLGSFLSCNKRITETELVEIFMFERCRNVACKRLLPVDDCDCKICSIKNSFCSECMCPVCFNFDCANNTCSWIGCDVCSHWCHAACGMQRNLIRPGPSLKGLSGTTKMQFHCLGCGHASEMFGFVKDVFISCAIEWSLDTLIRELNCVKKIFQGSEDFKGQQLFIKADEMVIKLDDGSLSPSDVCSYVFQFFKTADSLSNSTASMCSKDVSSSASLRNDAVVINPLNSLVTKSSIKNLSTSSNLQNMALVDPHQKLKTSLVSEQTVKDEWSVKPSKNNGFDSLESVVRIKEAEASMFQTRAEEARRDADNFQRMVRFKYNNLEEEYGGKLDNLCFQEIEERRRKTLEELKILEDAHCNYYKMKMRMQSEISGLLSRMEATKQLLM
ncbi:hypothetical protein LIER_29797 [Lithospermum erythrorhizon]|uniref:Protein OBERON 3 n=1 Tax=Lithospermum erythrorhizon TaxID=34254 RepID=A0AAV3RPD6_LITER